MSFKCCSNCARERLLPCFLKDPSNPASKELKTCTSCRTSIAKSMKKRKALQPLDPNIPAKRRPPPVESLTLQKRLYLYLNTLSSRLYPLRVKKLLNLDLNHRSTHLRALHLCLNRRSVSLPPLCPLQASFLLNNGSGYRVFTGPWVQLRWRPVVGVKNIGLPWI